VATDRAGHPSAAAYSPQLDGVRAVAVASVAWSHWLPGWQLGVPFGAGVHLFFVLSGFLITRILLGVRAAPDRLPAIGRFYLRRVLRLVPALVVVLGAAAWADVPLVRDTWGWHAAYLSNMFIAHEGRWQGHLSHFWSLAVEEQFYLVWPWLVVIVPTRWLGPTIGAAILLGPLARLLASGQGLTEPYWALVPGGSADSLGVGAWLALDAWRNPEGRAPLVGRDWLAGSAAFMWIALALGDACRPLPAAVAVWRQLIQGLVFGWIVWRAVDGFRGLAGRVLAHPVATFVGRISYGVYLIHAFAPVVVYAVARAVDVDALVPAEPFARAAIYASTTLLLATLLWFLIERPALAWKARVPYAR
jgi:peptidoglycan/LPS O-acetylase OafA/YrhL